MKAKTMKAKAIRTNHDNQYRIDAKVSKDAQKCAREYLDRERPSVIREVIGAIAFGLILAAVVLFFLSA